MLKSFRYLLLPITIIYSFFVWLRNWLYDKNILKSSSFNFPIICVGNLATGGTGKTPMTEYIIEILKDKYAVATLSRGYKRKTRGFAIAREGTTAIDIGDEPMQFHQKFPGITVAVGEERLVAIPQLLHDRPGTEVIVLDDAFQHRAVRAGLNIVLTEYRNLYTRDFLLPAGDLRDNTSSVKRAHIIIVTKCKPSLTIEEKASLLNELNPMPQQQVFFTEIVYENMYPLFASPMPMLNQRTDILLLCGIANPKPLKEYLTMQVHSYDMLRYADHHIFTSDDLKEIKKHFNNLQSENKIILTTEKDSVRLHKFENDLKDFPIFVLPIKHRFLFNEGPMFNQAIFNFIQSFKVSNALLD